MFIYRLKVLQMARIDRINNKMDSKGAWIHTIKKHNYTFFFLGPYDVKVRKL